MLLTSMPPPAVASLWAAIYGLTMGPGGGRKQQIKLLHTPVEPPGIVHRGHQKPLVVTGLL